MQRGSDLQFRIQQVRMKPFALMKQVKCIWLEKSFTGFLGNFKVFCENQVSIFG